MNAASALTEVCALLAHVERANREGMPVNATILAERLECAPSTIKRREAMARALGVRVDFERDGRMPGGGTLRVRDWGPFHKDEVLARY